MEWKAIESAPLREAILVYHKNQWTRTACKLEDGSWVKWPSTDYSDDDYKLNYEPTHFSEFPEPPTN